MACRTSQNLTGTQRFAIAVRHSEPGWTLNAERQPPTAKGQAGSALLLVLFAILLVASLVVAMVEFVKHDVDEYGALNRQFRARQLAQSGLAVALNPVVQNTDHALLQQAMSDGGSFRVVIASESARLNINYLLQNQRLYVLETLFDRWGVRTNDVKSAISGLQKWVLTGDPSNPISGDPNQNLDQMQLAASATQNAANGSGITIQQPLLHPFQAVQEMSLVPEFAPIMKAKPDWANYFTIWGDGKIDVNLADADMISLITGVQPAAALQFVKFRWGRDGIPYTEDDQQYVSMEQVQAALGLSQGQFQLIQDLLSLNSAVDRIESKGIIAGYTTTITAIANRSSVPIQYLVWQEK